MTKEEATEVIEYIKKYRELDRKLYTTPSRNFTIVSKNVVNKYLGYWDMAIKALEQQSKTGHWIDTGNRGYADVDSDNIILYQEMCNRCKCLSYFRKSSGLLIGAKYCPNCGAKMGSEVKE